ncbi:hypothetical protein [Adhaeribacter rhizoryzae]|uniref:Lipoprotein n=1 Tax=Adhaeribacter rhizoryzae TaxID=2607907 RepID=A0A5M6CY61_9BACT|nr:hypothetical protein [Adhaeribacter rhizoryzae]KAA5540158.1 hypothetical protein F0145_23310 [Adhaeribacter rhizoryzae]
MIFRTKYCRLLLCFLLLLILAQCSPQKKTEEKEPAASKTITPIPKESDEVPKSPTLAAEPNIKDQKNTKASKKKKDNIYALYQQKIAKFKFDAFRVKEKYSGRAATIDLVSHEDARLYQKTFTRGLAAGSNFAGKYTLVSVPCGDKCQDNYIIETQTGKVIDKVQSSTGVSFRPDSRLLIVNPPELTTNNQVCQNCEPIIYVLENGLIYKAKLLR